ncbi:MAG: patatin-like phospholipase family protein [Syntrophobacterales bacterium]|jgi:NTE family protein|nr:patatin-like phospholipase family protein [Syntrophobacterales bacterium]
MTQQKKIGLALGSGSARGWSHIGVIKALKEHDIPVDIVCGSSMGAVVGGAYAAGILNSLEELAREFSWLDFLKFMDVSLSRRGLLSGNRITEFFRDKISDMDIENLPTPYGAVTVDLYTGEEIFIRKGPLLDALRASFSFPGLFTPFHKNNQWLIDGGLINPVPVSLCRAMGADIVIAVNLNDEILKKRVFLHSADNTDTSLPSLDKHGDSLMDFLTAKFPFLKRMENHDLPTEKIPNMIEVMMKSIYIMQDRITKQRMVEDPPDISITPSLSDVSLLNFNKARDTIEEGRRATLTKLPEIMEKIS